MIEATFIHEQGFKFNTVYKTRGGFLRAIATSKNSRLCHALDKSRKVIIRPNTLSEYRRMK